jgi:hypothetical protein
VAVVSWLKLATTLWANLAGQTEKNFFDRPQGVSTLPENTNIKSLD